jgi:luciferase family oxidoreductase group 1
LDTLYPGRIDLGVGRAAGAGGPTVRAIRGDASERNFVQDIESLSNYLADNRIEPVRAVHQAHQVPIWFLGSSMYGAGLAAGLGLPFAFASHFSPTYLLTAIHHYRENFQPSAYLDAPYLMVGANVFAADTADEAEYLASSHRHWFSQLHMGRPGLLCKPIDGYMEQMSDLRRKDLEQTLACTAIGDRVGVGTWLNNFIAQTKADEVMIDSRIYDPVARCRSYQYAAESIA